MHALAVLATTAGAVAAFANMSNAQQINFVAMSTNHYNTHILLGKGGKLTAWQDCGRSFYNCPSKSTGTYGRVGNCIFTHIDWNMRTYNYPSNYPANGRIDFTDGQACE
jgi:hypothetical protein